MIPPPLHVFPQCDLVLDAAHRKSPEPGAGPKKEDIVESIVFKASDVVAVSFKDVDLNFARKGMPNIYDSSALFVYKPDFSEVGMLLQTQIKTECNDLQIIFNLYLIGLVHILSLVDIRTPEAFTLRKGDFVTLPSLTNNHTTE